MTSHFFFLNLEHFCFWWNFRCVFLSRFSIVHVSPKLIVASHFWLRRRRALYFSPNFEHFTIVRFWLNMWGFSLSQLSIVYLCLKLVVAPHFRLRCQRALYFSPNFEHFAIFFIMIKFALCFFFTIIYFTFLSENFRCPSFLTWASNSSISLP